MSFKNELPIDRVCNFGYFIHVVVNGKYIDILVRHHLMYTVQY